MLQEDARKREQLVTTATRAPSLTNVKMESAPEATKVRFASTTNALKSVAMAQAVVCHP